MEKPSIVEPAETNWERWEANKITASEKRILMTWVFGESYQELCGPKYKHLRATAFQRGGCALTLTGVNDHTVIPEGFATPLGLELPGVPFKDQAYLACAWSASDRFGVPLAPVPLADDDMDEKGEDSVTDEEMPDIFGKEDSDTDTDKEAEAAAAHAPLYDDEMILADLVGGVDEEDLFGEGVGEDVFAIASPFGGAEKPSDSDEEATQMSAAAFTYGIHQF